MRSSSVAVLFLIVVATGCVAQQVQVLCEWTSAVTPDNWPTHRNVLAAPVVANTPFVSNNNGVEVIAVTYNCADGGSAASAGSDPNCFGIVRILDGNDCSVHQSFGGGAAQRTDQLIGSATPAIADLDNDGIVEIVTLRAVGDMIAWKWDSTQSRYVKWWQSSGSGYQSVLRWDSPAIHDLNDDNFPEVINSGEVHDGRTGARLNPTQQAYLGLAKFPTVGNVDADPAIEIVGVLNSQVTVSQWNSVTNLWQAEYTNLIALGEVTYGWEGFALADFCKRIGPGNCDLTQRDGIPEIVVPYQSRTAIITLQKDVIMDITDGDGGGSAVVGTLTPFSSVPRLQVVRASRGALTAYDPYCTSSTVEFCSATRFKLWSRPVQDISSSRTAAGMFAFGEGFTSVVYGDECFTRVFRGTDGEVSYSSARSSCTWQEFPVIANTDGTRGAEVVYGSNDNCNIACSNALDNLDAGVRCEFNSDCVSNICVSGYCRCTSDAGCDSNSRCGSPLAGTPGSGNTCRAYHPPGFKLTGIRILTDALNIWPDAEPIWNQHSYSITNIRANGTVPRSSQWIQNFGSYLGGKSEFAKDYNNYRMNTKVCKCENGGQCTDFGTCTCPPTYGGQLCEEPLCFPSATPPGCQSGGLCASPDRCICPGSGPWTPNCVLIPTVATVSGGSTTQASSTTGMPCQPSIFDCTGRCGLVPDNGCGVSLNCPGCIDPSKPNNFCDLNTNRCRCNRRSCAVYGALCNEDELSDGCGGKIPISTCGSCDNVTSCVQAPSGARSCQPIGCVPTSDCLTVGIECGSLVVGSGCLDVTCGTCPENSRCVNGMCQCAPKTVCAWNQTCGQASNGCGGFVSCGSCPGGTVCTVGLGDSASCVAPTTGTLTTGSSTTGTPIGSPGAELISSSTSLKARIAVLLGFLAALFL